MGDILTWAKHEIELACKKEESTDVFINYTSLCYLSAFDIFKNLMEDDHSRLSMKVTLSILNRLAQNRPLTPIIDIDDVWNYITTSSDTGAVIYQCKRMSSLFKYIYPDNTVKYTDNSRCYSIDANDPNNVYQSSIAAKIIDKLFPITMPYFPEEQIRIYQEEFLYDKTNGDFDTIGILYALMPENGETRRVDINKFFKQGEPKSPDLYCSWIGIDKAEYETRKLSKIERK